MTTPISDEYLSALSDMLGGDTDFDQYGFSMKRETLRALLARIEALTVERDAAVAEQRNLSGMVDVAVGLARDNGITEGEARATAAIMAWLRETNGVASNGVVRTAAAIACAIERGEHLPAKSLDT